MSEPILGPIVFKAEVHFISDDGTTTASASVQFGPGRIPSQADVLRLVGQAIRATADSGLRLCTPDEFFNRVVVKDITGRVGTFAVPGEFAYDADALCERALTALAGSDED